MRGRLVVGLVVLLVLAGLLTLVPRWGLLARLRPMTAQGTGQPTSPPSASLETAPAATDPFALT